MQNSVQDGKERHLERNQYKMPVHRQAINWYGSLPSAPKPMRSVFLPGGQQIDHKPNPP
jgi:hypothetical protein